MPVQFVFWISNSTKLAIATRKNISFSSCYTFVEPMTYTITPKGGGVGFGKIRIICSHATGALRDIQKRLRGRLDKMLRGTQREFFGKISVRKTI